MEWCSARRNGPPDGAFDVLLLGELLVELASSLPLRHGRQFQLSFSGDTLNAGASAAAGGARVGVMACVGQDDLGAALLAHVESLGIDSSLIRLVDQPNGLYLLGADEDGRSEFVYMRRESAGSFLRPADVDERVVRSARALVVSGVGCAISESAADAAYYAAEVMSTHGGLVVYDPNFRRKLMSPAEARRVFARMAPLAGVVKLSWPNDAKALFDVTSPAEAAACVRRAGVPVSVVTLGADGALVHDGESVVSSPAVPAHSKVDATGCGDIFAGMLTARLALGDGLDSALSLAMTAAALSLGGQGGTGRVPSLAEIDEQLRLIGRVPPPRSDSSAVTATEGSRAGGMVHDER